LGNSLNYYNFSRARQARSAIINKLYTHFVNCVCLSLGVTKEQQWNTEQSVFCTADSGAGSAELPHCVRR